MTESAIKEVFISETREIIEKFESDQVRSGGIVVNNSLIDLILDSIDWIRDELFTEKAGTEESRAVMTELQQHIIEFTGEDKAGEAEAEEESKGTKQKAGVYNYFRIKARFREDVFETGIDPLMIIEDLLAIGTLLTENVDREQLPGLETMNPQRLWMNSEIAMRC